MQPREHNAICIEGATATLAITGPGGRLLAAARLDAEQVARVLRLLAALGAATTPDLPPISPHGGSREVGATGGDGDADRRTPPRQLRIVTDDDPLFLGGDYGGAGVKPVADDG